MSNLELRPEETICRSAAGVVERAPEVLEPREVPLGGPRAMLVQRTLPHRDRRMIGAWCFVDHYGPHDVQAGPGMRVPPHPHTGLQTVSWLLEGEILHRDSLGSVQLVRPGELNLMTSGRAIAHSEESPAKRSARLHGVQLWVALPDQHRNIAPWFTHHADLPLVDFDAATVRVVMGSYAGVISGAVTYTPLVAAEVAIATDQDVQLPLDSTLEHGVLALSDGLSVDGTAVPRGSMIVFDAGRTGVGVATSGPGQALLIGGEPFDEELVMWWNFVARNHEEIVQARESWEAGRDFGEVRGYAGDRLAAPPMPGTRLRPRPRVRPV
ncbi:MAG TPA: pirin family protein [Jiangellaceae bacterium]|nr:pirin family protein [Jiangellaceae bacterium]